MSYSRPVCPSISLRHLFSIFDWFIDWRRVGWTSRPGEAYVACASHSVASSLSHLISWFASLREREREKDAEKEMWREREREKTQREDEEISLEIRAWRANTNPNSSPGRRSFISSEDTSDQTHGLKIICLQKTAFPFFLSSCMIFTVITFPARWGNPLWRGWVLRV